jgi:hypothetical protein
MGAILRYFRLHSWQRRLMTITLMAMIGVSAAWVIRPIIRDRNCLAMLRSTDPAQREQAVEWAVRIYKVSPSLADKIEGRLDQAGDDEYVALATVLDRLDLFNVPARPGPQVDRYNALELAEAQRFGMDSFAKVFLYNLVRGGRDNAYVRQALALAVKSPSPQLRQMAPLLAARLGDDKTLAELLADADVDVRSAAALDAGLAGRKALTNAIAELFGKATNEDEAAFAAYALALLAPGTSWAACYGGYIDVHTMPATGSLQEKLVCVLGQIGQIEYAQAAVTYLLDAPAKTASAPTSTSTPATTSAPTTSQAAAPGLLPPAMAYIAAARWGLPIGPQLTAGLNTIIAHRAAISPRDLAALPAIVASARRIGMGQDFFLKTIRELWHKQTTLAMILAAEGLSEQPLDQTGPTSQAASRPARIDLGVLELMLHIIDYDTMPVPSAALAVAAFVMSPQDGTGMIVQACQDDPAHPADTALCGDYVAWQLSRRPTPQTGKLAEAMLTGPSRDVGVRSTGALLLAMQNRAPAQAEAAAKIIQFQMNGGAMGVKPTDPFLLGSYHCALLILGHKEYAREAAILAHSADFPNDRALLALALAGEELGFEQVLGGPEFEPGKMDYFLAGRLLARVYRSLRPELPAFDIEAPTAVRLWQCRILHDHYIIHKG